MTGYRRNPENSPDEKQDNNCELSAAAAFIVARDVTFGGARTVTRLIRAIRTLRLILKGGTLPNFRLLSAFSANQIAPFRLTCHHISK